MADLVQVDAERLEDAGGDPLALADEAEEQVLRADVVVAEAARLVDGQLDDALGARGQADLADDRPIAAADDELDRGPDLGQLDVHVLEDARGDTLALADEAEEQMLRADVVVVEPLRLVLRKCQDLARAIRELVEAIHRVERLFPCDASDGTPEAMLARRLPAASRTAGPMMGRVWCVAGSLAPAPSICRIVTRRCGRSRRDAVKESKRPAGMPAGRRVALRARTGQASARLVLVVVRRRPSSASALGARPRRSARLGLGGGGLGDRPPARRQPRLGRLRLLGDGLARGLGLRRLGFGLGGGLGSAAASRLRPRPRRLGLGLPARPRRRPRARGCGLGGSAIGLGLGRRPPRPRPRRRPRRLRFGRRPRARLPRLGLGGRSASTVASRRRPRLGIVSARPRRRPSALGVVALGGGELLADLGERRGERVVDPALGLLDRVRHRVAALRVAAGARRADAARRGRRRRGAGLRRRASRRLLGLLEAEAEAMALGVERDDLELERLALVDDVARMGDALVGQLADVDQALEAVADADEGAEVDELRDRAVDDVADLEVGDRRVPRVRLEAADRQADPAALVVDVDDLGLDLLADLVAGLGVVDLVPRELALVDEAVDAAEVDEDAERARSSGRCR